ncbi:MAG: enoyl-CoA hydratase/isomerase family protein [bacterium]|nr:enoyl-CoA hydratase/isomerase family protein [bacterium]MCY4193851.1 enoyl-CoA hydratase/isomerase family protein [bacterium]MCY4272066.1 enoyl-CoA hydratase/isomerase family protein [bacterium]
MSEPTVLRQDRDGIATVILNRPEKLNAATVEMIEALCAALEDLRDRDDLRVLVVRARGRYFCAGLDIYQNPQPDFDGSSRAARRWYRGNAQPRQNFRWAAELAETIEKPTILAAHAPCLGGALEFALGCDFRLAAESASFGLPEVTSVGVLPGSGGVSRLSRLVGPAWARWLVLAEQSVSSERALTMGLVHDVYPDDEFDERVDAFARHMAERPPEAFAVGKLAIELCADLGLSDSRGIEVLANGQLLTGVEAADLRRSFAERHRGR